MSRRIDVELTSDRGDGTWSWRAAGARQPKGVLDASLLYEGASPGDVVRAEADFDIDGITVVSVQPPKGARQQPPRIEIIGVDRDFSPITSSLTGRARERAERGEDDRPRRRDDRGPRSGAPGGRPGGPPREGARGGRPGGGDRPDRPSRPPRPEPPAPKPKAKKLRPARVHRDALLAALSPEQQPIAEQLLRGGMPAVRAALEEQNAKATAEGGLTIPVDTVLGIAEQLVTRARVADWLDRAEAAKATGEELALRDLRSVVSSADDVARDESTRELAAELKAMLEQRTESEQATWLTDIERSLRDGRVVRALRLSSRPPEPGTSFPAELTARLTEAANGALTADIAPDRWATVLDAVAYSPVRRAVVPAGIPAEPGEELVAAVRKHAGRTPAIATLFGVEPPPDRSKGRGERPARAAGRNANLSRAGGPRNATVPVPGRPGGPPVPPAKRIPPPPGRQIGATLPGSPPAVATPPAARAAADPTAPLAPPSATGTGEPIASLGTPEAAPAELDPTSAPPAEGAAAPEVAAPDAAAITPDVAPSEGAAAPADAEVAAPDDAGPAALPDVAPSEGAVAPVEAEVAAPDDAGPAALPDVAPSEGAAAPVEVAAPGAEAMAPDVAPSEGAVAPVEAGVAALDDAAAAVVPDVAPSEGIAAALDAEGVAPEGDAAPAIPDVAPAEGAIAPPGEVSAGPEGVAAPAIPDVAPAAEVPVDPEVAAADPEAAMVFDAAPALIDGPPPEGAPAPAALATDQPPPAAVSDPIGTPDVEPRAAEETHMSDADAPGAGDTEAQEVDVALTAPSDSSLPEDPPTAADVDLRGEGTGDDPGSAPGGASTAELDALVSQAAEGPFEPPAHPPVEGAPNGAVGTVASEHEGGSHQDQPAS